MTAATQHLLVIRLLDRRRGEPVAPGAIAEKVDRSEAATAETLRRLESAGWITYDPSRGASLTADGRVRGTELFETYVTLSRLFDVVFDAEEPDREAMELAGTVSKTVADRLDATLLGDSAVRVVSESADDAPADPSS